MIEKLTDEQLRRRSQADPRFVDQSVIDMATELLALRAERAKPTQSDIECGQMIAKRFFPVNRTEEYNDMANQIASIRAEGSAEREKLEQEGQAARDALIEFASRCGAERAKLEAALGERAQALHVAQHYILQQGILTGAGGHELMAEIDRLLAQPAESGATE